MNNEEFIEFCNESDIKLIPSIPLFDPEVFSKVLNNHLDSHVDAILDEVESGDYDGIDIDYEATYLKDKDLYLTMYVLFAM